jgi:hypothetical protein
MYNIIAMDHPNLKPDNSVLFKSSFLRTVKYKRFALKQKSVALKRACFGEEDEKYRCCCHGAQNISVTNKNEEICVKICISI